MSLLIIVYHDVHQHTFKKLDTQQIEANKDCVEDKKPQRFI